MNLNAPAYFQSRFPRKTGFAALAAALAIWNCDTQLPQLAGSSVGTGNPTEIEVAFTDGAGALPLSGRMDVYAATQIPVPGFSQGPLISKTFAGETRMNLSASDFVALQDSLWPQSSVEGDSTCRFNVVVTGDSQGTVLKGLGFRKNSGTFELREEDSAAVRNEHRAEVRGALAPLVDIRGRMNEDDLNPDKNHFLFVYGTGFYAQGESDLFVFQKMPEGEYESFLLSFGKEIIPIGGDDSLFVFSTTTPLVSGKEEKLDRGSVKDFIPYPDSLKVK